LKDHLGSVRSVVDNNSTVLSAQDYYPYGETIRQFNNNRYLLTEKERDAESGNDYFGARYYNNKLGVWLQVDPLADEYSEWSPYHYVLNNPMRYIDPFGLGHYDPKTDTYIPDPGETVLDEVVVTAEKQKEIPTLGIEFFSGLGVLGTSTDISENIIANDYFIFGKNGKFYNTGRGLNQYTASLDAAKKVAKPFKIAGKVFFFVRGVWVVIDLKRDFNWSKFASYGKDLGLDAISLTGLPGMFLSIYLQSAESFINMRQGELLQVLDNQPQQLDLYLQNRALEDAIIFGH